MLIYETKQTLLDVRNVHYIRTVIIRVNKNVRMFYSYKYCYLFQSNHFISAMSLLYLPFPILKMTGVLNVCFGVSN